MSTTAQSAKNKVEQTANEVSHSTWVDWLARIGYVARGVLYIVVGVLAVQAALGVGGGTTDKKGALETIGSQPFGKFLLVLVAIGLAGYALWGVVRSLLDPLKRGTDPKGIAVRIGYMVSAFAYASLLFPTIALIRGSGSSGPSQGSQDMTATLLSAPLGQWLVVLVGVIGMIGGLGQLYLAFSGDFKKDLKTGEMSSREVDIATKFGRFGSAARGVIFILLGFFVVQAALQFDPKKAQGLDGALQTLAHQPYGPFLLGIVALGLVSFGIYSILCAKWIKITRQSSTDGN